MDKCILGIELSQDKGRTINRRQIDDIILLRFSSSGKPLTVLTFEEDAMRERWVWPKMLEYYTTEEISRMIGKVVECFTETNLNPTIRSEVDVFIDRDFVYKLA